jgi:hypothetical protein
MVEYGELRTEHGIKIDCSTHNDVFPLIFREFRTVRDLFIVLGSIQKSWSSSSVLAQLEDIAI